MNRPNDWSPLADRDPTPGDPNRVQQLANQLANIATEIDTQTQKLKALQTQDWESQAEQKFKEAGARVAQHLSAASGRYHAAAQGVQSFVTPLETAQSSAGLLLDRARQLNSERADAQGRLNIDELESWTNPDGTSRPKPRRHYDDQHTVDTYPSRLRLLQQKLEGVEESLASAGRDAAGHIRSIADHDALHDSKIDRIRHAVEEFAAGLGEALKTVGDAVIKVLKEASKILSAITAVVSILALVLCWVPGLGPILGTAALLLSLASLAVDLVLAATGNGGWDAVLKDLAGVVLGGVAKGISGGFRGALAAGKLGQAAERSVATIAARGGNVTAKLEKAMTMKDLTKASRISGLGKSELAHIRGGNLSALTRETGVLRGGTHHLVDLAHPKLNPRDFNPFTDLKFRSSDWREFRQFQGDFSVKGMGDLVTHMAHVTPDLDLAARMGLASSCHVIETVININDIHNASSGSN